MLSRLSVLKFYFSSSFFPVDTFHVVNPFSLIPVIFCIHEFRGFSFLRLLDGYHSNFFGSPSSFNLYT